MNDHRIFPHGKLSELVPGVWQVEGSLPFPLPRNMTVYRLPDGELLLYSVVALDENGMQALEALGKPAVMVVPHPLHVMDAPFYKRRYPHIRVIASQDAARRLRDVPVDASPADGLGELGIRHEVVPGLKFDEVVLSLDTATGRAIVVTDLLSPAAPPKLMLRIMGPPGGVCGVPRIVKFRQVRDKKSVRRFVSALAERPGHDLLLFSHGPALRGDVAGTLREAAARV